MTAVLMMLVIFAVMALGLSVILVATLVNALLAAQVRQIGVMKAIGGRTGQIAGLYLVMVLVVGAAATALGTLLAIPAARAFAAAVGELLNFTITDASLPSRVFAALLAGGLAAPLLAALVPILRGSRITVQAALADVGVKGDAFGGRGLDGLLASLRGLDRTLLMGLRNAFRRRGRLLLTLGLLAAGGGMFMTGLNVRAAWDRRMEEGMARRHFDVEVDLNGLEPVEPTLARLRATPGVQAAEAWGYAPAALARTGLAAVERTYPDGGHGSLTVRGVPAGSTFVTFPLLEGRWLRPGDTDAMVLNQGMRGQLPHAKVGDAVTLAVDGRPLTGRVVGIVEELGAAGVAYVPAARMAEAAGAPGQARSFRVAFASRDPEAQQAALARVEAVLRATGASVALVLSDRELRSAVGAHLAILIDALLFMALLMALVGALGLASAMGTSVVERTREFAIMRTLGGTPRTVLRNVLAEGVFIGALSFLLAVPASLPFSLLVGRVVGNLSFRTPLPFVLSHGGTLAWLAIVLLGATLASLLPARRASQLTVQDALATL
jgi:putative ABC transport system permease protein